MHFSGKGKGIQDILHWFIKSKLYYRTQRNRIGISDNNHKINLGHSLIMYVQLHHKDCWAEGMNASRHWAKEHWREE